MKNQYDSIYGHRKFQTKYIQPKIGLLDLLKHNEINSF